MSEIINNREYRQKVLKELKNQGLKNYLIMEGMPVEEIQRLCDVHAAVFKGCRGILSIHLNSKMPK